MNIQLDSFKQKILVTLLSVVFLSGSSLNLLANDIFNSSKEGGCTGVVHLSITLDNNADEISWTLVNTDQFVKVADGEYFTAHDNLETVETSVCLTAGCYELTVYDSWGDGITNGSVENIIKLADQDGELLINTGGDFGDYLTIEFCVDNQGNIITNQIKA